MIGSEAGLNNTGDGNLIVGYEAGQYNEGDYNIYIGLNTATNAYLTDPLSSENILIGTGGGLISTGYSNIMIGSHNYEKNGTESIMIGSYTTLSVENYSSIAIGYNAGVNLTDMGGDVTTDCIFIGSYALSSITGDIENAIALGTNSKVEMSNTMVLGDVAPNAVNVGIRNSTPDSKLDVNGYSKLGSDAPAIQLVKFTGTLPASQGQWLFIPHGLDPDKILNVDMFVEYTPGWKVPEAYTFNGGYEFNYLITSTNFAINILSGNSQFLVNDEVTVLVTYEE
jgi:hypothetical protein